VPSVAFARALGHTAPNITKVSAVLKLWEYCKQHALMDDMEHLRADATLEALLGVSRFAYADVPRLLRPHLLPLPPVHLTHLLTTATTTASERWFELLVDVPTPQPPFERHGNEEAMAVADRKLREVVTDLDEHRHRRRHLVLFTRDPLAALELALAQHSDELRHTLLPQMQSTTLPQDDTERKASTYARPETDAAIDAYARQHA